MDPNTNWFPSGSLKIAELPQSAVVGCPTNSTPRAERSLRVVARLAVVGVVCAALVIALAGESGAALSTKGPPLLPGLIGASV